ncbi:hypothetical protein VTN96DRAFT_7578 [Rasamsonia emersonii]
MSPCNITLMMSVDLNQLEVSIMHLQREVAQQLVYLMNLARRLKARLCESAVEARFPKTRIAKQKLRGPTNNVLSWIICFLYQLRKRLCVLYYLLRVLRVYLAALRLFLSNHGRPSGNACK